MRLGPAHRETNRLTIAHLADTASVFLSTEQLAGTQELIGEARRADVRGGRERLIPSPPGTR